MSLTSSQLTALATAINADPALTTLNGANGFQQIADAMNAASSPAVPIWIPNIPTRQILTALLATDMTALSTGNLGYMQMLLSVDTVDATSSNVRTNFSTIFSGKTTLANLTNIAQRTATRFEALAAFTSGTGTLVSTAYGITVSARDVQDALGK